MPIAGYRPSGSHPEVIAACLSLRTIWIKLNRPRKKVRSYSITMQYILAQLLKWLMLITITIGMCLMNGYEIVKVQTPFIKGQTGEGITPSPVCSLRSKI